MTEVYLDRTVGWLYNTYNGVQNRQQSDRDVKKAAERMAWVDKGYSYRNFKQIGNIVGPILAARFIPYFSTTTTSMFSWPAIIVAGVTSMTCAIPHECLFKCNSYVSTHGSSMKSIFTLGLNSAIEAGTFMVLSTLAHDYFWGLPKWVTYTTLGVASLYFKAHLNLYESSWPDAPNVKVKITSK